jgi:twinkle protein
MKTFIDFEIDLPAHARGEWATTCPKCSGDRKKKNIKCLSVNVEKGTWNCHHCGWTGGLPKTDRSVEPEKVYVLPKLNTAPLSDLVVAWFKERGISAHTITRNKITESTQYLQQAKGNRKVIDFNYFRDGELINTKYRSREKHFKLVKDAELILYKLDDLKGQKEAIIAEGEPDALSWEEAGIKFAVSVPNGANLKKNNLTYIDNCVDELKGIEKFYLATDADAAGLKLRDELAIRLGRAKCFIITFPEGCKDSNDVLVKHGPDKLLECKANATPYPIAGIYRVDDLRETMIHTFHHGKRRGETTHFKTIDPHFTWKRGELMVMTGYRNHGKTELMLQLMLVKSVFDGWKWAIYSPENYPCDELFDSLIHAYVGKGTDPAFPRNKMTEEEYKAGMDFINNHFFAIYPEEGHKPQDIIDHFKILKFRYGIDGCLIDPWNQLDHSFTREDQYLSSELTLAKRFALEHDVCYVIIAHPKTITKNKDGSLPVPDDFNLSGGFMWGNKCDNVLAGHRPNWYKDKTDTMVEFHSHKIKKQKLVGLPGFTLFTFDRKSNRYFDESGNSPLQSGRDALKEIQPLFEVEPTIDADEVIPF